MTHLGTQHSLSLDDSSKDSSTEQLTFFHWSSLHLISRILVSVSETFQLISTEEDCSFNVNCQRQIRTSYVSGIAYSCMTHWLASVFD